MFSFTPAIISIPITAPFHWQTPPSGITVREKNGALVMTSRHTDPAHLVEYLVYLLVLFLGIYTLGGGLFFKSTGETWEERLGFLTVSCFLLLDGGLAGAIIGYFLGTLRLSVHEHVREVRLSSGWWVFRKQRTMRFEALHYLLELLEKKNTKLYSGSTDRFFGYVHYLSLNPRNKHVGPWVFAKTMSPVRRQYLRGALNRIIRDIKADQSYFGSAGCALNLSDHLVY